MTLSLNSILFFALGSAQIVLTVNMSLVLMGFTNTMMLFSEEKDLKTLDALLITPATIQEVICGKLLVNYLITFLCTVFLLLILFKSELSFIHIFLTISQGTLIFCLLGMCVGIILPNQKVASSFGSLIMITLFIPELLAPLNSAIAHFARGLPTYYINQILKISKEAAFFDLFKYYLPLFLFLLGSIALVLSLMKNVLLQEESRWSYSKGNKLSFGFLFVLALSSSFLLRPTQWEVIDNSHGKYLTHVDYQISLPYLDENLYLQKTVNNGEMSTIIFQSKDKAFYLF